MGSKYFMIFQETSIGPSKDSSAPLLQPPPGLESPVSSKEADQPSPVSVLEAPFTDDLSSCSECFESLNADLHGNFKVIVLEFLVLRPLYESKNDLA